MMTAARELLQALPVGNRLSRWAWPIFVFASVSFPINEQSSREFIDAKAEQYRQEYAQCTGKSGPVTLAEILRWREELRGFTRSPAYAKILATFAAETKADPRAVLPCQVMAWYEWHKPAEKKPARKSTAPDSTTKAPKAIAPAPKAVAPAPKQITLDSLEFGSPRDSLYALFSRNAAAFVPVDSSRIELYVLLVDDRDFPAVLTLSPTGLCAVSVTKPCYPVDSLDNTVRSDAEGLTKLFAARFGAAGKSYRAGLLDIKESGLAPVARWDIGGMRLWVGLSRQHGRYCAAALLVHKDLSEGVKMPWLKVEDPEK